MSRASRIDRSRWTIFVVAILGALLARTVSAQPIQLQIGKPVPDQQSEAVQPDAGMILADRETQVSLSRAVEFVAEQRYAEAVPLFQQILDGDKELAYPTDTREHRVLRNLRIEAERLIGNMPPAGLRSYDLFCGAEARKTLEDAVQRFDIAGLTRASRRFFHTDAGAEATFLLGTIYLDQGRPFDAALWLERLLRRKPLVTEDRDVLAFQTAIAWGMVDRLDLARPALAELKRSTPSGELKIGGRTIKIFSNDEDAIDWLRQSALESANPKATDIVWSTSRGNAARSGAAELTPGALDPQLAWNFPTSRWKVPIEEAPFSGGVVDVSRQIAGLENDFQKKNSAAIPSTEPLIVGDVALVRTHRALRAFDLESGKPLWESDGDDALEKVRRGVVPPLPGDTGSILDPLLLDRIFENATFGTMSAADDCVFVVEDLGFLPPPITWPMNVSRGKQSAHPLAAKTFNRLCAFDTNSGKLKWSAGGKVDESRRDLAGYFFLGAPLPVAHNLFCLAEANKQIELLVLDSRTGKLDWSISLQSVATDVTQDEHRGISGLSPSFSDCVLVCPTGSGLVVGVDLATRQLMWSYRYRELEEGTPQDHMRRMMMARMAAIQRQTVPEEKPTGQWRDSLPLVANGRVLITPRDSSDLLCLDLHDGSLLWKLPKEERQYIGGVYGEELLVVGRTQIEMFNVANGRRAWADSLAIAAPSGRGLLVDNRYLIPLSTGVVATVNLDNAKIDSELKLADDLVPGNLVAANGFIISQGSDSFACFKHKMENEPVDSQ